jgi:DUF971 family protein
MSEVYPAELKRSGGGSLVIAWSDGAIHEIPVSVLRKSCPCARCRAEAMQPPAETGLFPVLAPAQARPLAIVRMAPVGNYAYAIEFSDSHSSGIYTFDFLRLIGAQVASHAWSRSDPQE